MRKLLLSWVVLISFITVQANPTLRCVIFADTKDQYIGKYCEKDTGNVAAFAKYVASCLRYDYKIQVVDGFTKKKIDKEIAALTAESKSEDIILFYVSGHGVATVGKDGGRFPDVMMEKDRVSSLETYNKIKDKVEHHSLIALFDVCNVAVPVSTNYKGFELAQKIKDLNLQIVVVSYEEKNSRIILVENKVELLFASSAPDQESVCIESGSVFTNEFIHNFGDIMNSVTTENTNIDSIVKLTITDTEYQSSQSCSKGIGKGGVVRGEKGVAKLKACTRQTPIRN